MTEMVQKLLELEKKVNELEVYEEEFITQSWIDNYNGKEPHREYFTCIPINGEIYEKVWNLVEKLLSILYPDKDIKIDKIEFCKVGDKTEFVIQLKEDQYNEYGRYIGTDYWWTTLTKLIEKAEEKLKSEEQIEKELKEKLEKLRSALS